MLRHYESLGLVQPSQRTDSGYREYCAKDIRRIFHIESLRSLGLSLRDIGRALDDPHPDARVVHDQARVNAAWDAIGPKKVDHARPDQGKKG